jgi:hypothetical protein
MIAAAIAAGGALALGLLLPVLVWRLPRVAGREDQALVGGVARTLARVARSIPKPAPPDQGKDRDEEARPCAREAV